MTSSFLNKILLKIDKGDDISPFLFMGKNLELLNASVKEIAFELLSKFDIPKVNLFILHDNGEKIKIEEIKKFLELSNSQTPYKFQIFLIENTSRMTVAAANSCLKIFEEPGKKNIIFLTNSGEAGVLDTILSRVEPVELGGSPVSIKDEFLYSLIDSYISGGTELVSYFFRNKLEKDEYIRFLQTILLYTKDKNILDSDELSELIDDINAVALNNVNVRGVVDKWILKLK